MALTANKTAPIIGLIQSAWGGLFLLWCSAFGGNLGFCRVDSLPATRATSTLDSGRHDD